VGEVETGEAALDAARELRPDLVLMDVNLPGISGLEATRVILADSGAPPPMVIVFSTYEPAEYGPRAAEAGAAGYITKSELSPERLEEVWAAAQSGRATTA
jgi:DNA-binding NarL/FixJ family response regulator